MLRVLAKASVKAVGQAVTPSVTRPAFRPFHVSSFISAPKEEEEVLNEYGEVTGESIDDTVASLDLTLTPEQTEYVEKLKLYIRGGPKAKRTEYTAVPLPHEVEASGNFLPHIAPNAEEMINWALSHVPKRDGPRRSNDKKRSQARMAFMKSEAAKKKKEMSAAALRKQANKKRVRMEILAVLDQAANIKAAREQLQALRASKTTKPSTN